MSYHDAPVFTITYYVQWLLMEQRARAGYKISISGTAADELFSGYYDHYLMLSRRGAWRPERLRADAGRLARHVQPSYAIHI